MSSLCVLFYWRMMKTTLHIYVTISEYIRKLCLKGKKCTDESLCKLLLVSNLEKIFCEKAGIEFGPILSFSEIKIPFWVLFPLLNFFHFWLFPFLYLSRRRAAIVMFEANQNSKKVQLWGERIQNFRQTNIYKKKVKYKLR